MPADKSTIKSKKPLMEKRRRARINDSLMQLKKLVLDAVNKNNPRHSKLEKADILDMTVRYLRTIQRQQISASVNNDPSKLGEYHSGYAECVNEVTRYISATPATDGSPELRTQLVGHLVNLCTSGQQQQPSSTRTPSPQHHQQTQFTRIRQQQQHQLDHAMTYVDAESRMSPSTDSYPTSSIYHNDVARSCVTEGAQPDYALTTPVYNNTQQVRNVIPPSNNYPHVAVGPNLDNAGRPTGEITVVLPQQTLPNGQLPTHFIPVYAQGPLVVSPTTDAKHKTLSPSAAVSYRTVSHLSAGTSLPASPVSACTSPVTFVSSPLSHAQQLSQAELSPAALEQYAKYEMATPISNHWVFKRETMWRPW